MADPDLQIRVGGGVGHPHSEIRGGGGLVSKKIFSSLWASFWSKNKGEKEGGTGLSPGSDSANGPVFIQIAMICYVRVFLNFYPTS